MKKLAKFMAFVMLFSTLSSFNIMSANAEMWTKENMQVSEFDFNNKSTTDWWIAPSTVFDATATGGVFDGVSNENGNGYRSIDTEHGVSVSMSGGAGIGYIFNRTFDTAANAVYNPVTGRIHFSFDVYALEDFDGSSRTLVQFNDYTYNWDNQLIDFRAGQDKYMLPQNGGYGETQTGEFSEKTWYRVDLNIDAKADSAIADVYINGKYKSTTEIGEAIDSVWIKGYETNAKSGYNGMVIDNVRVQTESKFDYAKSINFDEKTVSSQKWANEVYSPADATGGVIVKNSDTGASYQKIDDEHNTSYVMTGGSSFKYIFNRTFDGTTAVENAVTGKFKLSFDMYNKLHDAKTGRIALQVNNYSSYSENDMIAYFQYSSSKYAAINKSGVLEWNKAFEPEKWHKVELEFDATQTSTKVLFYLDNEYMGTKTYNVPLKSIGLFSNSTQSNCYTAIDNIEVSAIADVRDLTAAPAIASIKEDAQSIAIRYTGTLDRDSVNDEPEVIVSEYDKDTGLTRTVDAYAEIDYTATKLNVYFNEKLNDNSELTVTLPEALKGLFTENVATKTVTVTTKMSMDYFDNFDGYSNAAKMPRFSNREFSGAEGYSGGQALTSVYNQNTIFNIPEPIVTDNATTDYIVSFDMKIPDDSKSVQFYVSYYSGSAFQWKEGSVKRDWNETGSFTENKWHHYDFIFDYDKSDDNASTPRKRLHVYQDGVKLTSTASYGLWGTLSYIKLFAEENYPYHIDNFHARYRNEVDVTTNLEGTVSPSTKEAYIKFDDAVDVNSLNNIYIEDENVNKVEYEIKSSDAYGMTISFADGALVKGKDYTLVIEDVETYAGEPISGLEDGAKVFNFSTNERFEVTDAKIKNGTSDITSVSEWLSNVSYKVELTLDSTRTSEQTIYAVVAGYKQTDEFVNVQIVPVKVTASGTYPADLAKADMTGVDKIKIFAVDGYQNFAPLMKQAKQINK